MEQIQSNKKTNAIQRLREKYLGEEVSERSEAYRNDALNMLRNKYINSPTPGYTPPAASTSDLGDNMHGGGAGFSGRPVNTATGVNLPTFNYMSLGAPTIAQRMGKQTEASELMNPAVIGQMMSYQKNKENAEKNEDYRKVLKAEDFAEKSQYVPTNADPYSGSRYELVNKNPDFGDGGLVNGHLQYLNDEERGIYNYLYATRSEGEADDYLRVINKELTSRQAEARKGAVENAAKEDELKRMRNVLEKPSLANGFGADPSALRDLSTVLANMTAPLAEIGMAFDYATKGSIDQNAWYNAGVNYASDVREARANTIEKTWGKVGSTGYQLAMSGLDFAANLLVSSAVAGTLAPGALTPEKANVVKNVSLALMGTGAAASETVSAKKRGLSDSQAFSLGLIAGATEVITENVSLEAILNPDILRQSVGKYILSSAIAEGSEEVMSDLINTMADISISRDKSEWETAISNYMADGKMDRVQATRRAFLDQAIQLGVSFVGGAALGGLMSGVRVAAMNITTGTTQKSRMRDYLNQVEKGYRILGQNGRDLTPGERELRIQQVSRYNAQIREMVANGETQVYVDKEAARRVLDFCDLVDQKVDAYLSGDVGAFSDDGNATSQYNVSGYLPGSAASEVNTEAPQTDLRNLADEMYGTSSTQTPAEAENQAVSQTETQNATNAPSETRSGLNVPKWSADEMMNPASVEDSLQQIDQIADSMADTRPEIGELIRNRYEEIADTEGRYISADYFTEALNTLYNLGKQGISARQAAVAVQEMNLPVRTKMAALGAYDIGKREGGIANGAESDIDIAQRSDSLHPAVAGSRVETQGQREDGSGSGRGEENLYADPGTLEELGEVSNKDIFDRGIGGKGTVRAVMPSKEFVKAVRAEAKKVGFKGRMHFVDRQMTVDLHDGNGEFLVDGYISDNNQDIFVNVNASSGGNAPISERKNGIKTVVHELTHYDVRDDKTKVRAFRDFIKSRDDELAALIEENYKRLYQTDNALVAWEEAYCDAAARINAFAGSVIYEKAAEAVRANRPLLSEAFDEAQKKRGPPERTITKDQAAALLSGEDVVGIETIERYSYATLMATDMDAIVNALKKLGYTETEVKRWVRDVYSVGNLIHQDPVRLDYVSASDDVHNSDGSIPKKRKVSSFVSNAEYGGSIDSSTICAKRRLYTGTIEEIQFRLPNTVLTEDDYLRIKELMEAHGLEVQCAFCYVEGSRLKIGEYTGEFLKQYKATNPMWMPTQADLATASGLENTRVNHNEAYEAYLYFMNNNGRLDRENQKALFASQQKPKLYMMSTAYDGEIRKQFLNIENVKQKNENGGIRFNSFSDQEIFHLIDTMQVILDMSSVGLAGQGYTKQPIFAKAFGGTGMKINLSTVAKGVDENGRIIFENTEGMNIEEALKIRNGDYALNDKMRQVFRDNVGIEICVFNDEQLFAAMRDPRIDFIIPFHRSQYKKAHYVKTGLAAKIDGAIKDYTNQQNEKWLHPKEHTHEYQGRTVLTKCTNYMPNTYWDSKLSGKENAEKYLEMCFRDGKRPKFYKLLKANADGSYSLRSDGSTDGYWKLLSDYKMYATEDGVITSKQTPQMPVKPEFNMDAINSALKTYQGQHRYADGTVRFESDKSVVEEFLKEYKEAHKGDRFSKKIDIDGQLSLSDYQNYLEQKYENVSEDNIKTAAKATMGIVERIKNFQAKEVQNAKEGKLLRNARTVALGITSEFVKTGYIDFSGLKLDADPQKAAGQIAAYSMILRNPNFETFRILYTKGNTIVGNTAVTSYNVDTAYAALDKDMETSNQMVRDQMKRLGADGYYLMHNHPSGDVAFSSADQNMTSVYKKSVNGLKGHIIIDHNKYGFFDPALEFSEHEIENGNAKETKERLIDSPLLYKQLYSPDAVAEVANQVVHDFNVSTVIYSHKDGIRAMQEVDNRFLLSKDFKNYVKNRKLDFGATQVFLVSDIKTFNAVDNAMLYQTGLFTDVVAFGNGRGDLGNKFYSMGMMGRPRWGSNEDVRLHRVYEDSNRIRFSRATAPEFYSKLEREIEAFKGDKIGASSAVSYLKGKGVKDEEIKWSGIETFLEGKKSVSKSELVQYLKDNELKIEEEELGTGVDTNIYGEYIRAKEDLENEAWNVALGLDRHIAAVEIDEDDTLWKAYGVYDNGDWTDEPLATKETKGTKWHDYKTPGGVNYREVLYKIPNSTYSNDSMRVHWGEKGVLAHARIQDFETADGKILFVDEIQSDWHNAGEKGGYAESETEITKKRVALEQQLETLNKEYNDLKAPVTYKEWQEAEAMANVFSSGVYGKVLSEFREYYDTHGLKDIPGNEWVIEGDLRERMLKAGEEYQRLAGEAEKKRIAYRDWDTKRGEITVQIRQTRRKLDTLRSGNTSVPDAPFRNGTYVQYVLKDLLRKAVEGGYDYLAWTTGKMQEERWSDQYAEGYRIEYDQDIPKFLSKYGKQWGAKLTQITLDENAADVAEYKEDFDEFYHMMMDYEPDLGYDDLASGLGHLSDGISDEDGEFSEEWLDRAYYLADRLDDAYREGLINADILETDIAGDVPAIPITEAMRESVLYEGQPRFSRSEEREQKWQKAVEKYRKRIDSWDEETVDFAFIIGDSTEAMIKAGIPDKQIRYDATKASAEVLKHSGMGKTELKKIPDILHDPIAIIDAKKYPSRKIVIGSELDSNGKTIIVVIETKPHSRKGNEITAFIRLASSQGRSHIGSLFDGVQIRYVSPDTKKVQDWLVLNRVQFPLGSSILNFNNRLSYPSDSVKSRMSRSTDSEGRQLTEQQEEFFRDSKARDKNGNLLVLYHGTSFAGFNQFKEGNGIFLTTSKKDADSYGGTGGRLYDPSETQTRRPAIGGDYRIGTHLRFETENDRSDFLKRFPDAEEYMTQREMDAVRWDVSDSSEEEFNLREKRNREIIRAYYSYENQHSDLVPLGEVIDNYEQYSLDDIKRAWLAWDQEASVDDYWAEYDTDEEYRKYLADSLKEAIAEMESSGNAEGAEAVRNILVRARIPVGAAGEIVNTPNKRTYELYANITHPFIKDYGGKNVVSTTFHADIDKVLASDEYDGFIGLNAPQGAYQVKDAIAVVVKRSNQVKLTSNKNPSSDNDIRFSRAPLPENADETAREVVNNLYRRASFNDLSMKYGNYNAAAYTDKRMEQEIGYSYAEGSRNKDYARAYIAFMNPSDFIRATSSAVWRGGLYQEVASKAEEQGRTSMLDLDALTNERQSMYLRITTDENGNAVIDGHEGRHRMIGLEAEGYRYVPVIIEPREYGYPDGQDRYHTKPIEVLYLEGQQFRDGSGTGIFVHDILPLSANYADIAREVFASGNNVTRFSRGEDNQMQILTDEMRKRFDALEAEVRKQTDRAAYFKGQTHLKLMKEGADRYQIDDASLRSFAKSLNKAYSSNADIENDLRDVINDYLNGRVKSFEDMMTSLRYISGNIVSHARELMPTDNRYDMLKEYLKKTPFSISDQDKADIPDFEAWRRRNLSKIRISNSGTRIDKDWGEIQDTFGRDLFPDSITHPADMLLQLERVLEAIAPEWVNPFGTSRASSEAVDSAALDIYERITSNDGIELVPPTFADKQKERRIAEVNAVRNHYKQALDQVRKQRDDRIEALKAHHREVAENKRLRRIDADERRRLLNIVKRLNNMKLPAVQRQRLDEIIGQLDTISVSITGQKLDDLTQLYFNYLERKNNKEKYPDFISDPYIEKQLERLAKIRIKDLSQQEVAALTQILLGIEYEIRNERKLIEEEDLRDTYDIASEIYDDVLKSEGTMVGLVRKMDELIVLNTLSPKRAARRMVGYKDDSPLVTLFASLADGSRKSLDYIVRARDYFKPWTNDLEFMDRISGKKAERIEIEGEDVLTGKRVKVAITPAERISLYEHSKNDDNLRHIANGGITIPDFDLLRKGKIDDAYAKTTTIKLKPSEVRGIAGKMGAKERAFADAVTKWFDGYSSKAINETSEALKGYSIANVENYFPIETNKEFLDKSYEELKFDGTIEGMGFLKERVHSSNPILLRDVLNVLDQNTRMTAKYVGLAIPIRNFNKVSNARLKKSDSDTLVTIGFAINEKWGPAGERYIDDLMSSLQNRSDRSGIFERVLNNITSNYAAAVLELNASVAIKQTASYPTALAVLDFNSLRKALADTSKLDTEKIKKYTPLFEYRSLGFSTPEMGEIASGKNRVPAALKWIQFMDLATTGKLWKASEYYIQDHRRDLTPGSEAYYKAVADIYNEVIEDTQPNYTAMQRPGILRSQGAITRAIGMFKTQPFQNFNILWDAVEDYKTKGKNKDKSPEERAAFERSKKKLAKAIISQVLASFVFALMQFAWDMFRNKKNKYADEDGEITALSTIKGFSINMLTNAFGMIPLGSEAFEIVGSAIDRISNALDGGTFFDQSFYGIDVPVLETLNGLVEGSGDILVKLVDAIHSASTGEDVDGWETVRDIYKSTAELFQVMGLPVNNVVNLLNAIVGNACKMFNGPYVGEYYALRIQGAGNAEMYRLLYRAYKNDRSAYAELYQQMIEDGYSESAIKSFFKKQGE